VAADGSAHRNLVRQRHGPAARAALVRAPSGLRAAVRRNLDQTNEYKRWSASAGKCGAQVIPNGDQKGYSVAISNKTAVVSVPGMAEDAGTLYIFEQAAKGPAWHLAAKLPDPRKASKDLYAYSVAISSTSAGTYVAVGGNDYNCKRNFVYIYKGSGKAWHLQQTIRDPGSSSLDMFGDAVAMTSTMLVIGASCRNKFIGAGYVYLRFSTGWKLVQTLSDPFQGTGDSFGQALSITGSTIFVGANAVAYVYTRGLKPTWKRTATLFNPGPKDDAYGDSVTIGGTTAIVGAPNDLSGAGSAYIWRLVGKTWEAKGMLKTFPGVLGGQFGRSVNLTGNRLIVGMPVFQTCGTAFVFRSSGTKWIRQAQIMNPRCAQAKAGFGFSVSGTSSSMGIFGAPDTNNGAGAAYMLPLSK